MIIFPNALTCASFSPSYGDPYKKIILQPQFKWSDHTCTQQGTGSFIRTPDGKVVGLTSAHFINFSGSQLLEVNWLDIRTKEVIATSVKSWGLPGREGSYNPLDLRPDYLITLIEDAIDTQNVLEIDDRNIIEEGERIWFPNKNALVPLGYDLLEGKVSVVADTHLLVILDNTTDLQARSGSPIISQKTGKVIGIIAGGDKTGSCLFLTPASSIYKALVEARTYPLLKNVIGFELPSPNAQLTIKARK